MKTNRRGFLKMAGLAGAGVVTGCTPGTGGQNSEVKAYALDTIKTAAERRYEQAFNMSGYCAPALDVVRIGFIGVGSRGSAAVERISRIDGIKIMAICDVQEEHANAAKARIKSPGHEATLYTGGDEAWMELCRRDDIDLVYVATHWELHAPIGIYAMENGKHAALEIPAATTVEDCWKLVETSEKTKKHCVMLENCCYDFFELLTLNLARNGFFGEIIHTEGAYIHDLAESLFFRGKPDHSWRLKENMTRNGNLYPTHGLGPVAQIMNINRGNRMEYLTSMSSNDFMMNYYAKKLSQDDAYFEKFVDGNFRGNMNSTIIRTIKGQTILVQHDVSSPRPYSRLHTISGTKAMAQKYPLPARLSKAEDHTNWLSDEEFAKIEKEFNPPIVQKMQDIAKQIGGHGGMDFLMDWRMIDCLRNGLPMDMDVYDAAAWSVIGPLSEWSVANRSTPIDIPDFTGGAWETNIPHDIELKKGGTTGVLNIPK